MCIFAAFIEIMEIEKLRKALQSADAIIVGAGAGLSTSADFYPFPEPAGRRNRRANRQGLFDRASRLQRQTGGFQCVQG